MKAKMTITTFFEASPKQIQFIQDLIEKKNLTETANAKTVLAKIADKQLDKKEASKLIDELIVAKPLVTSVTSTATPSPVGKMQILLAEVPKAKYAVPMDEIDLAIDEKVNGDILFIEVREYMNVLYMRRLHGAPGNFNRSKLSFKDTESVINLVKKDALKYTQLFGEVYKCCGKCGADLTDQLSRELKLGPTCRKEFGFKM
jgi:hypothetical protein